MKLQPNTTSIRDTYRWLAHADLGVSEVRVIRPQRGIVGIGFFDDEASFVAECARANDDSNVYVGIQPRSPSLLRLANNVIRPLRSGGGTMDVSVVTGTVIDIDPVRPKDQASTNAELREAIAVADDICDWCEEQGLLRPVRMISGNGAQLWFAVAPIHLTNGYRQIVQQNLKRFEAEIRQQVGSDLVKVDSIHDIARIIKVIGTVSRKGYDTEERPHRASEPLDSPDRQLDEALRERLLDDTSEMPLVSVAAKPAAPPPVIPATATVQRDDGEIDWEEPVEMCSPVRRLWHEGCDDRSVAIFDMVRFFMHKGLPLDEITTLIVEYDRRGLGKLRGRDGAAYVRQCYDKIAASPTPEGTIAPPCHSLQKLGLCNVNREPGARCERYSVIPDIDAAIEEIPEDCEGEELEERLQPILDEISFRDPLVHGLYATLLKKRFGLKKGELQRAIETRRKTRSRPQGAPAPAGKSAADEAIDGEIYEDATCYFTFIGPKQKSISSFTITPTVRIQTDRGELICGKATTDKGAEIDDLRLPVSAFSSKRDLIRQLGRIDLQWTGSDANTQGLLRVLARYDTPRLPSSSMLGEYMTDKGCVWLHRDGVLGKDGPLDPSPVVYMSGGGSLDRRAAFPDTDDATFQQIADTVFRFLPSLNAPDVVLPVIGWFFATPMKVRVMQHMGSFPSLIVWGTQGSGKSTMISDVMWPLFGVRDGEPYSATETEFALLKLLSASSSVPVFIDEYKPFDMPRRRLNTLHRLIRRIYRGEIEERGRADQTTVIYRLQAPLCIAGETRPSEAALLERIITANPGKLTLDDHPKCREALRELKATNLHLFAARYVQFCLGRDVKADLETARKAADEGIEGRKVPVRVRDNVTVMLLGIYLFKQFAEACGCELPANLGVRQALRLMLSDVIETDYGVKNALDSFVQMLGVMAVQGELRPKRHYVVVEDKLHLHLESCYDLFRRHCKSIDYEGEITDLKALRRLIRENRQQGGYVTDESYRVYFDSRTRRRTVAIDFDRAKLIEQDDFPVS